MLVAGPGVQRSRGVWTDRVRLVAQARCARSSFVIFKRYRCPSASFVGRGFARLGQRTRTIPCVAPHLVEIPQKDERAQWRGSHLMSLSSGGLVGSTVHAGWPLMVWPHWDCLAEPRAFDLY